MPQFPFTTREASPIFAWGQLGYARTVIEIRNEATAWTTHALIWCQICSLKMQEIALPGSFKILNISQGNIALDPLVVSHALAAILQAWHLWFWSTPRKLLGGGSTLASSCVFVSATTLKRITLFLLLDYCNPLLYGAPKFLIQRLQHVQNAAARLLASSSRFEHVTPILMHLHWLPVCQRIKFKISCLLIRPCTTVLRSILKI